MASTAAPPSAVTPLALASHARPRPTPVRRPTSQILSYYHSEAANAGASSTFNAYEYNREGGEGDGTVSWEKTSGNGKRSASPIHLSDYFEFDNDTKGVRDSALTEGPIEYGIAVGTPSGLLDRPGASFSFYGSTGVHVPTVTGSGEPAPKPMAAPNVTMQAPALGHRRRTSARSTGGEDKRRVAVVEVDSASEAEQVSDDGTTRGQGSRPFVFPPSSSTNSSTSSTTRTLSSENTDGSNGSITSISSLISRRGHHKVALLLPAASPSTTAKLSYFTPPLSAPVSVSVPSDRPTFAPPPLLVNKSTSSNISTASVSSSVRHHKRSQSEAVLVSGRLSPASPSNFAFEQPATPPAETTTRRGHKQRASSRDIGIVGAHIHSLSPSPPAEPISNTHQMQIDVRPFEGSGSVLPNSHGPSAQRSQQLSPIFQRPSLSQASSYASSPESNVQPMNTSSTEQNTGAFSVFKESNRRTLTQADTHAVADTSTGGSNRKTDSRSSSERNEQQRSNESRQPAQLSSNAVGSATANGHASSPASVASPLLSGASQAQARDPSTQTPYLHYLPGLHATAGPLPSPPKLVHSEPDSKKATVVQRPSIASSLVGAAPPRPPRFHTPRDAGSLAKPVKETTARSLHTELSGSSFTPSKQPSQATPSNPVVTPSTTSSTLVESLSESSVKGKHTREGAFPISVSVIGHQIRPVPHDTTPRPMDKEANDKLVAPSGTDLKRKNTMEELVKDVTAAIDELSPNTSSRIETQPSHSSRPVTRERSATTIASTSETRTNSDTKLGRQIMDDRTNKPSLTTHRSALDLRRQGSKSTFKGALPPTRDGSDSDYSDSDFENITVSRVPNDPLYHVRSPGMHAPSASMSDSGHGSSPGGSLKGPLSPQSKILDFASAIKRFSALPRTPSRLSVSRASQHSSSVGHDQNTHEQYAATSAVHLVPYMELPSRPKHYAPKIKSAWPEAMHFGEVLKLKSPLERSIGYARKINELANHDPGLGDWVICTKENLTRAGTRRKSVSPTASRSPAEQTTFQPRHVSRGSIGSEMTFPKRIDAYVATDLIPHEKPEEGLPRGPSIPYPTLPPAPLHHPTSVAAAASAFLHPSSSTRQLPFGVRNLPGSLALSRSGTSATNGVLPTAGSGNSGGGFFSSIGRKTSIKRDRPAGTGLPLHQPNKLLSKRQQTNAQPSPRPIQITASPSLPGGPRAPPGRAPPVARAQSVIAPRTAINEVTLIESAHSGMETDTEPTKKRRLSIKRTASVQPPPLPARSTTLPPASGNALGAEVNLEAQLTKLADLLPTANRTILEGYLRRAGGSEMLAIGRYLDDEKNGALRRV